MSLQILRPMLWTEDLAGSVDFYTGVLRFEAVEVRDDWGWASLRTDDVWLMLSRPNESRAKVETRTPLVNSAS